MNSKLTPYQKRKHQQVLDEKYLEKQLILLTQNKTEILFAIREYRKGHFSNYRNQFVSIDIVSKLLNSSKRTIRLLATQKHISSLFFTSYSLFSLNDICDFIKSLKQTN